MSETALNLVWWARCSWNRPRIILRHPVYSVSCWSSRKRSNLLRHNLNRALDSPATIQLELPCLLR